MVAVSKLNKSNWEQILQLGDQTGTLTFNDISVIKTVIQKLKRKVVHMIEKKERKLRKLSVNIINMANHMK